MALYTLHKPLNNDKLQFLGQEITEKLQFWVPEITVMVRDPISTFSIFAHL